MGYWTAEDVLLPARFLTLTAHFVAVVTILMDQDVMKASAKRLRLPTESFQELARLQGLLYGAVVCLSLEYVSLFKGTSLFMRTHNCIYILLHVVGAAVTGLLYTQGLTLGVYVVAFTACNVLPAALEALTYLIPMRLSAGAVGPRQY